MARSKVNAWPMEIHILQKMIDFVDINKEEGLLPDYVDAFSQPDMKAGKHWVTGSITDEEFMTQLQGGPGAHWRKNGDDDEE